MECLCSVFIQRVTPLLFIHFVFLVSELSATGNHSDRTVVGSILHSSVASSPSLSPHKVELFQGTNNHNQKSIGRNNFSESELYKMSARNVRVWYNSSVAEEQNTADISNHEQAFATSCTKYRLLMRSSSMVGNYTVGEEKGQKIQFTQDAGVVFYRTVRYMSKF